MSMTLKAETNDFKSVQFTADATIYTSSEKLKHGLKSFFIFFFIAVFCILIPILHFVLVPGFLLFAIYKFIKSQKEVGEIVLAKFNCPNCANLIELKNVDLKFPHKEYCPQCRTSLKIETV